MTKATGRKKGPPYGSQNSKKEHPKTLAIRISPRDKALLETLGEGNAGKGLEKLLSPIRATG